MFSRILALGHLNIAAKRTFICLFFCFFFIGKLTLLEIIAVCKIKFDIVKFKEFFNECIVDAYHCQIHVLL